MSDFDYLCECPKCKKTFEVSEIPQTPGFRWKEELVCPYCSSVIRSSMEYEFIVTKRV